MIHTMLMAPVSYAVLYWSGSLAMITEALECVRVVLEVLARVR